MAKKLKDESWRRDLQPVHQRRGFRCQKCKKPFRANIVVDVPIAVAIASMRSVRCPYCGSEKLFLGENRTLTEDREMRAGTDYAQRLLDWKENGETGQSSKTIAEHMSLGTVHKFATPLDHADLMRCVLLTDRFPEWGARMNEMSAYNGWSELAAQWPLITSEIEQTGKSETALAIFAAANRS